MRLLTRLLEPKVIAHAHCDLPCGVYDPAQARIEAESIKGIDEKYAQNTDTEFRARAIVIKEQRSELVKHHLWVLWTDYFKPPHFEKYPQLNTLFNEATKLAGAGGTKGSTDVAKADALLGKIDEINKIFWETKQAHPFWVGPRDETRVSGAYRAVNPGFTAFEEIYGVRGAPGEPCGSRPGGRRGAFLVAGCGR